MPAEYVELTPDIAPQTGELARVLTRRVIGGSECVRDFTLSLRQLERAREIQLLTMPRQLPVDQRLAFSAHYIPYDMVGGDYYTVASIGPDRYGFLLADITGHGVSAALYTMQIHLLWEEHRHMLEQPEEVAAAINRRLCHLVRDDEYFASCLVGYVDARRRTARLVSAGHHAPILFHEDGDSCDLDCRGLMLGLDDTTKFCPTEVELAVGDRLLMFTDGAIEVRNADKKILGREGLIDVLRALDYPSADIDMGVVEQHLLRYSDGIRLEDDLTLLEIHQR